MKKSLPIVSVIVPAYNSERYIGETLSSVLSQTFSDFEVLIVDDGSTDNQKSVIEKFVTSDSRVKYFYQNNLGVSAARNKGISEASGNLLAFLDSDDIWLPTNLELKVHRFEDPNVALVHSDGTVISNDSSPTNIVMRGIEGNVLDQLLLWEGTQIPGPSSILVKKEAVETIGGFDVKLSTAADKDFFIRLAAKFAICRVPTVTWKYRVHPNNMHKNISLMERDVLYLYSKARAMKLFRDRAFERQCFSSMYLIMAASWAGDGRSPAKAIPFLLKAVAANPRVLVKIFNRILRMR